MFKKAIGFFLIIPLVLTGCNHSRPIETAAVIETVSVERHNGRLCYTFYPLTDASAPDAVEIPASSFEEARRLARSAYIPNMSLAKLELLLIREDVVAEILRTDIEYISTQASFSPVAYVALCDAAALRQLRQHTEVQQGMKRLLRLCRRQHPEVNIDYLSVFNSYARGEHGFSVPMVSGDGDLRVSARKLEKL